MTELNRPLVAAVIGLGVGAHHARAYASSVQSRLKWVYDLDPELSKRTVGEIGAGTVASSFEAILADPEVDVVSIASYDTDHATQTIAALRAGKHVFVEKPLCRTEDELRSIRSALNERQEVHLDSNLVLRASPLYRWLRDAIRGGELGEIYSFDGDYLFGRLPKITEGWRKDVPDYSVMLGGGIHLVDLLIWLTGQHPSSVTAAGNRLCTEGTPFRSSDFVAATYHFPSGLIGRVTANFGCVHRHQHVMRVFGTRATFIHDDAGTRVHLARDPGGPPRPIDLAPLPADKGARIPSFLDAIRTGADPRPAAEVAFAVVATCLAADRAVAEGGSVEIGKG